MLRNFNQCYGFDFTICVFLLSSPQAFLNTIASINADISSSSEDLLLIDKVRDFPPMFNHGNACKRRE